MFKFCKSVHICQTFPGNDSVVEVAAMKQTTRHTALIASGSDGPAPELQQVQVPPSVPGPTPPGAGQGN